MSDNQLIEGELLDATMAALLQISARLDGIELSLDVNTKEMGEEEIMLCQILTKLNTLGATVVRMKEEASKELEEEKVTKEFFAERYNPGARNKLNAKFGEIVPRSLICKIF